VPTSLRLSLVPKFRGAPSVPEPFHVHAVASTLMAESDEQHQANDKAWSIAPPVVRGDRLYLLLNWLPDSPAPDFQPICEAGLRLGRSIYGVEEIAARRVPFALLGADPSPELEIRFMTPTWFTRNGGEYALPDPSLVFRRLSERWAALCPEGDDLDPELADEVVHAARITRFEGYSAPFESGRARKTGFLGWARYQLPRSSPPDAASALTRLGRFAAFSGVGAMTTYGAGHVVVEPGPGPLPRGQR
jgi:CRISPR-associated endoribonuclease Cas6